MWILSCTASVGYLSRMTQWKVRYDHRSAEKNCLITLTGLYRASSPYQMKFRRWTRVQKEDSSWAFSPIRYCKPQISCFTGMSSIFGQACLCSRFQRYACTSRRGPNTAFGVCKTMRRSVQYRPWRNPCEATNCPMCVHLWSFSVSIYPLLNITSVCKACYVTQRATSQNVKIPRGFPLTNPNE